MLRAVLRIHGEKRLITVLALIVMANVVEGETAYQLDWTRLVGSTTHDSSNAVTTDMWGNVYISGSTIGEIPGQISAGSYDSYLTKFDPSGNELWTRQFGGSGSDESFSAATDQSGNIYISGATYSDLDGNISAGSWNAFLTKFDSSGNKIWTRLVGTQGQDKSYAVATDSMGNIYIGGDTTGEFDSQAVNQTADVFVAKFDPLGNRIWTQQFGSTDWDAARSMDVDAFDNLYISGQTREAFDGHDHLGGDDAFIAKYDSAGNKLWTRQLGTESWDASHGVAIDYWGNAYISGRTTGQLEGNTSASPGKNDAFLIKYDPSGNQVWTRQIGTEEVDVSTAVATDAQGNAFITGYTAGGFDGFSNAGLYDSFLIKYDPMGNQLWTQQIGSYSFDESYAVEVDATGNVYISGYAWWNLEGQVTTGADDAYLVKFIIPEPTTSGLIGFVGLGSLARRGRGKKRS